MNFLLKIILLLLCFIRHSFTSLTKPYDLISNHVMKREGQGEFFLSIKSDKYFLNITRLELIREEDDLIFDSSDNIAVVSRDNASTRAFGYIDENRFYGQFESGGRTFFIDDSNKVGVAGTLAILYSLEDILVDQSSLGSSPDTERTVEKDPDSPQSFIDRQREKN